MQYLRYLKQFFQIMFKIENNKEIPKTIDEKMEESDEDEPSSENEDETEELKTGSSKLLLTAVGIGYHNLTKTLI